MLQDLRAPVKSSLLQETDAQLLCEEHVTIFRLLLITFKQYNTTSWLP